MVRLELVLALGFRERIGYEGVDVRGDRVNVLNSWNRGSGWEETEEKVDR